MVLKCAPQCAAVQNHTTFARPATHQPLPQVAGSWLESLARPRDYFLLLVKMAFAACNGVWVNDDRRDDGAWRVRPASKASW